MQKFIDLAITKRDKQRLEIAKVSYRFGEGDSEQYLAQLSSYGPQKAATFQEWSRLSSQVIKVKTQLQQSFVNNRQHFYSRF
ncbi:MULTISPECIES: hypothetical protein [unclassified Synechocystis]|uniref:hypothetical protein n=1 Tax=unclassified Synechocystis TaxID=2640012 RepID=UPI000490A7BB|nr:MULTISPECIES: hypothetical protein [unclassified Synechocystis]AIE73577.1 hypothetical protein D082_10490 [Synechocystis sp. PCC 6714]